MPTSFHNAQQIQFSQLKRVSQPHFAVQLTNNAGEIGCQGKFWHEGERIGYHQVISAFDIHMFK